MKWCRPTVVTKKPMAAPMPAQAAIAISDATQGSTPLEEQQAGDHHRQRGDRTDRKVDAARDQQDRHADDDDAFDREGHRHGPHVVPGQEIGRGEGHHDEQHQDDEDQPGLAHPQQAAEALSGAVRAVAVAVADGVRRDRHCSLRPHRRRGRSLGDRGQVHDVLLRHLVARDLAGDAPLAHDQHAVADADQFGQLGRDDDDADAVARQVAQDAVDLGLGADIDAARRLVEEDHLRARPTASWRSRPSAGCRPTASRPAAPIWPHLRSSRSPSRLGLLASRAARR